MPASDSAGLLDTSPVELAARIVLAGGLAIWLALRAGPLLLELLIPYLEATVHWLDSRYRIDFTLTLRTGHEKIGSELVLLGKATVSRLFFIPVEGRILSMQPGQFLTSSTAIGVLMQPAVAILALVLGWPARTRSEFATRALFGLLMLVLWLFAGLPCSLWLYFHDIPLRALAPGDTTLATPIGKFLLNGGSVALGIGLAAVAIASSVRVAARRAATVGPGQANRPHSTR
jgi:hypothetical protein